MRAIFTIEPGQPGTYRYVLRRADGDVLVTSEPFGTVDEARDGIAELRACVAAAELVEHDAGPAQGRQLHPHEHPRADVEVRRTIGPDEASTS